MNQYTRVALARAGYDITVCTSTIDALETFRVNPEAFDVVVAEQTMKGLSGEELAKAMLEIKPGFPFILCSESSESAGQEEDAETCHVHRLRKPVVIRDLTDAIRHVMAKPPMTLATGNADSHCR